MKSREVSFYSFMFNEFLCGHLINLGLFTEWLVDSGSEKIRGDFILLVKYKAGFGGNRLCHCSLIQALLVILILEEK